MSCGDNAVADPIFSSLKMEWIRKRIYSTRDLDLAHADVFDRIEVFNNRNRRHSISAASVPRPSIEPFFRWGLSSLSKRGLTSAPGMSQ